MDLLLNPLFFLGVSFGFSTLILGIWIGAKYGRNFERHSLKAVHESLQAMSQQLTSLAESIWSDVHTYHGHITDFQSQVTGIRDSRQQECGANPQTGHAEIELAKLLQTVIQVNEEMKQRLVETESRLENHALTMQSYITEARTDALTGLDNRRILDQAIDKVYLDGARGSVAESSIILLDLDHFKKINDKYGHQIGDEVLKSVGKRLREAAVGASCVARYGGEEFVALLPVGLEKACRLAEEIRDAIASRPVIVDGHTLSVSASLGVAVCESVEKPKSWVRRADAALYFAKGKGRNCVAYYYGGNCLPFGDRPTAGVEVVSVATDINESAPASQLTPEANHSSEKNSGAIEFVSQVSVVNDSSRTPARSAEDMLEAEVQALKLESAKARVARRLDAIVREEQGRR